MSTPASSPTAEITFTPTPRPAKTYPKVKVAKYKYTYDYVGAWHHFTAEVTVVDDKVVEAFVSKDSPMGKRMPADDELARTLNELLRQADSNEDATVVWPAGQPYPSEISFDNPDAFDEEQRFIVKEFEELR